MDNPLSRNGEPERALRSDAPPPEKIDALCAPLINERADAERFIRGLYDLGLIHHFDDGAIDCLFGNGLCSHAQARCIDGKISRCYEVWNGKDRDDCPIGYALECMEKA